MKKVIFVCLLTISVCFSLPTEQSSQAGSTTGGPKPTDKDPTPKPPTEATAQTTTNSTSAPVTTTTSSTTTSTKSSSEKAATITTTTRAPTVETTQSPSETGTTPSTTTTSTTTPKPGNAPTSEVPVPNPKTVVQARGFDGASFVGGIILTLGLIAIGFMGLKYYRAQTERNYHTL